MPVPKFVQSKKTTLKSSISAAETTSIILTELVDIYGNALAFSDYETTLYITLEPASNNEEIISCTGFTVNSDGSATLDTGIVRGLSAKSPYGAGGTARTHASGVLAIAGSNNPQLYGDMMDFLVNLEDAQTIAGVKSFSSTPVSTAGNPTADEDLARKAYVDLVVGGIAITNQLLLQGTAGETVAAGDLIYFDSVTNKEWMLCDADTAGTVENIMLGIAQGAGTDGNPITSGVLLRGVDTNQTGMTGGEIMYAGNTAGEIVTPAGTTEVTVGLAYDATTLYFNPRFNQNLTEDQQDALAGTSGTPSVTNKYVTDDDTSVTAVADKIARYDGSGELPTVIGASTIVKSFEAGETIAIGDAVCAGVSSASRVTFDADVSGAVTTDGSGNGTITFTVGSNSNRALLIFINKQITNGSDPTSVKWAGVSATVLETMADTAGVACIVLAPTAGANNVTFSSTAVSTPFVYTISSWYNVDQGGADNSSTINNSTSNTSTSLALTPIVKGCVVVGNAVIQGRTFTVSGFSENTGTVTQYLYAGNCFKQPSPQSHTFSIDYGPTATTTSRSITAVSLAPVASTNYGVELADASSSVFFGDYKSEAFIGIAKTAGGQGDTIEVITKGEVSGLTGLTATLPYYVSDTAGDISSTAGSVSKKIGLATSDTEVQLD